MKRSSSIFNTELLILCCFFFNQVYLHAQCGLSVYAGEDQFGCTIPSTFQLSGSVNSPNPILSTEWTPTTGLSDPNSLNTSATISNPTTYRLTAKSYDPNDNLVINGDFSAGNTGFNTDYTYNANPSFPGNELVEGQYSIGDDPAPMHINWVGCGDHTTGNGDMMLVNGHETANQNVWCQSINIIPNTEYVFSAWVTSVDPNGPCLIQFNINGTPLGAGNLALSTTCLWQNIFEIWNSGPNTTATVCIEDLNTAEMGNDFAIDDILLAPVCEEFDEINLNIAELNTTADNDGPICEGETLTLTASGGETYDWRGPSGALYYGESVSVNDVIPADEGTYTVTVTDINGCTSTSITEVVIAPSYEMSFVETTCDSSLAGLTIQNLSTQFGCDSTITTTTLVNPSYDIQLFENTCDTTIAGVYTQILNSQFGCDSTVTTTINLNPSDSLFFFETTCDSTLADVIVQDLSNQYGCDSTVTTTISYQASFSTTILEVTCDSSLTDTIIQNLTSLNGCDSIVTTVISFAPSYDILLTESTCDSTLVGVTRQDLLTQFGCDSIIVTTITKNPIHETNIFESTCDSTKAGIFTQPFINQYGCDSIITTQIIYEESITTELFEMTCDTAFVGRTIQNLSTQLGCDSTVYTNITLFPTDQCKVEIFFEGSEIGCNETSSSLSITALIGEAPFDYILSGPITTIGTFSMKNVPIIISDLPVGIYTITVTSANGLSTSGQSEITLYDSPIASSQIESDYNGFGISCSGKTDGSISVLVDGGVPPYQIEWSTGQNIQTISQLSAGIYNVTIEDDNGCQDSVQIILDEPDSMNMQFSINGLSCFDQEIGQIYALTDGGIPPYTYRINNSLPQSIGEFTALPAGLYSINSTDSNGCQIEEFISINNVTPVSVDLGDDLEIDLGSGITLEAIINLPYDSIASLNWESIETLECPSCPIQEIFPVVTSTYGVNIIDNFGCEDYDEVTLSVMEQTTSTYIPNVFSPNGDGKNDLFFISSQDQSIQEITSKQIFSRWGELIFSSKNIQPNDQKNAWDGTYNGSNVSPGVYVWLIEITYIGGKKVIKTGDLTIVK